VRPARWRALAAPALAADPGEAIAVFARAPETSRFLWLEPRNARALVALGEQAAFEASGPDRFAAAAERACEILAAVAPPAAPEGTASATAGARAAGPLLVGGFGFADDAAPGEAWAAFPPARFALPELVLRFTPAGAAATLVARADATADPAEAAARALARARAGEAPSAGEAPELSVRAERSGADYRGRVTQALGAIERGELEKVVVARGVRVACAAGFDVEGLLRALAAAHPGCTLFAVARGGAVFLGATPERLLRLEAGRVETAALAGTAARGSTPEEDARLARELLESKKTWAEHAAVVRSLREGLAPFCATLSVPEAPRLRRLEGLQHLETPIAGRLAAAHSLLALAGQLHPAPSVAGTPRDEALAWLRRHEPLERGWYAGAVGFVDARGEGELCVALRCGLFAEREARLFAGAGIVAGSDPAAELAEARLKLRALLGPLLEQVA
jgi:isochorismate synthase